VCVLTILGVLAWASLSQACHQPVRVVNRVEVVKEVVVVKEVAAFVASFVPVVSVGYAAPVVPAYGLQQPYGPPAQAVVPQQAVDPCAEVRQQLAALAAEVKQLRNGGAPPPVQPMQNAAVTGRHVAVLAAKCAKCHTGATARGKLQLYTAPGQLNPLAADQKLKVLAMVRKGLMPPKPEAPLTEQEISDLHELLD
jgi:mono/diheme cytochrome c family protein